MLYFCTKMQGCALMRHSKIGKEAQNVASLLNNNNNMAKEVKKTQVENKEKGKVSYPLTKINFILMGICLLLIIIGFWLMTGDANVGDKFNENLFETSRVTTGPIIAFLGFVLMAFAIIYRKKDKKVQDDTVTDVKE